METKRDQELLDRFGLVPEIAQCVHSGFCCKQAPCPYGEVSPVTGWCKHLVEREPNRFYCGNYDFIIKQPGNHISPAFGAGCCSPLFNVNRNAILRGEK